MKRYLSETDWAEWEKNEQAKAESAVHKSLMQTAWRMKNKGYEVKDIASFLNITPIYLSKLRKEMTYETRAEGKRACTMVTFAPAYKKNLTPKFVFRTGTPGDYAAKVGKISELRK